MSTSRATVASALLVVGLLASVSGPPALMHAATDDPTTTTERIGLRQVDGVGEFYRTASGECFVPRGVNYIDFRA